MPGETVACQQKVLRFDRVNDPEMLVDKGINRLRTADRALNVLARDQYATGPLQGLKQFTIRAVTQGIDMKNLRWRLAFKVGQFAPKSTVPLRIITLP